MMKDTRVERVLEKMKGLGIDQFLVSDPDAVFYLTGKYIFPGERFYALLLRTDRKHVFFVNKLFPITEDLGVQLVVYDDTENPMAYVEQHLDADKILGVDKDLHARFIVPLLEDNAVKGLKNASVAVDVTRGIKDEEELEKLFASSRVNDEAMAKFKELVHPGVTEIEIADQMLGIYKNLGAQAYSFDPLVAFGANAAEPHHSSDNTVLKEGDCVLLDVGCVKDMYCSDMTRTFFYKYASDHAKEVYKVLYDAQEYACTHIEPGMTFAEIDALARKPITDAGYGEYFTHRLGHFIGLADHEYGDVSSVNTNQAVPNMVFSIEPGIYIPGDVGMRIEDLVVVTEKGATRLNNYPRELQIIE